MIEIDGSYGEGGGQILRSALALSMVTGKAFRITNIRGGRKKPGLLRQHLTGVNAASKICGAICSPVELGATELEFRPNGIEGGNHRFAVGTAGSAILVLQTVLPALLLAKAPSTLIIEGGTHAKSAPTYEFFEQCFAPVLHRMGARIETRLLQHGFYPAGGGRIQVEIEPTERLDKLELCDRGELLRTHATVLTCGMPAKIARKENAAAKGVLGWADDCFTVETLPEGRGPGNVLLVSAQFTHVSETVSGFGEMGVPAFRIGAKAGNRMKGFLESTAAVGPYLADQLLLPMALAGGGRFTTVKPSEHSRTNASIIEMFTGLTPEFVQQEGGEFLCTMS